MNENGVTIARQSHLVGGLFCLSAVLLGHFVDPVYFYIAAAPAFGLLLDAVTGVCLMSIFLKMAPWNRNKSI
ncbi:MAG: DUF2892 domain-containing protein [Bdellovibrionales bacterium]|nr:DUF2892 domain-containing protein [Bdellovibrionales bacterium]